MGGEAQISTPLLYVGIIICLIWLVVTILVKKQKRRILLIIGGAGSIILLVYTLQWKLYMIGIFGGFFCGSIGIGYRQDKLRKLQKEIGIVETMIVLAIFFALLFMLIAVAVPNMKW